jgi:hypothetical protein
LCVGESQPATADLLAQSPVLGAQILDDVLLATVHPAS